MKISQNFGLLYILLVIGQIIMCCYTNLGQYIMLTMLPAMVLCIPTGITTSLCMIIAFAITGIWWIVCSLPLLKHYKQTAYQPPVKGAFLQSFHELWQTIKEAKQKKHIFRLENPDAPVEEASPKKNWKKGRIHKDDIVVELPKKIIKVQPGPPIDKPAKVERRGRPPKTNDHEELEQKLKAKGVLK